ncbi:beta-1,3-galactosyltransferase 4-like [Pectinophora gossypiella]|uniref:beta-1,3-galactosyltransferase 4-like n=1 Tax=Pectinophora gossypiella TaxID=13191 RepID=UPI00214EB970|nr:beta-1,3-galactosyltransferase 4-like [Pectinophora gossypiella]
MVVQCVAALLLLQPLLRTLEQPQSLAVLLYGNIRRELYMAGHRIVHSELCPRLGAGLTLLVLVTSAPEHTAKRAAVRKTWGSLARRRDIVLAFVIGQPPQKYQKRLAREDVLYGDVIQGNWVDSYSNLTLKVLSMLEWADTYCPRAPRVLKTDDDVFLNLPRLLNMLAEPQRAKATRTIWGEFRTIFLQPKRNRNSKWYLSMMQYPSAKFPPYMNGPGYVLTADCVGPLLKTALRSPYVRIEDAFITGVLAEALGFKRFWTREFISISKRTAARQPCAVKRAMLVHRVSPRRQYQLWRQLRNATANCL